MKKHQLFALSLFVPMLPLAAQLNVPSDGSDGVFSPTVDIEVDLSQAITGVWSDDNSGANVGRGIYDPNQWAVVFEYSSVNIPAGVTVTFKNHPSNPPVFWLVSGDVVIDGTVDLRGESEFETGLEALVNNLGGPGGFRGGADGPEGAGRGLGIGGAGSNGGNGQAVFRNGTFEYSNPAILPLIGGSGGFGDDLIAGSGGGGAILVATNSLISIDGLITCQGGDTVRRRFSSFPVSMGAGGAIKLIAPSVTGGGSLDCRGGFSDKSGPEDEDVDLISGSEGRIRIETEVFSGITSFPETVAVSPANPPLIFPPSNAPTVTITSVDSVAAPADPTAPLQSTADIAIQDNDSVTITLQTTNFPLEGVVQVRVANRFGSAFFLTATNTGGTINSATWEVQHTFDDGFTALQARATAP